MQEYNFIKNKNKIINFSILVAFQTISFEVKQFIRTNKSDENIDKTGQQKIDIVIRNFQNKVVFKKLLKL